jgi:4-amino-4-deoxy-L-arabinose transferase-like glycosyltransferase
MKRNFLEGRIWILLALAMLGLALRLGPLLRAGVLMDPDSARYIELAQGLNHGCGFARWINGACGEIETLRTPGYPLFLATMPTLRTAVAIQGVIGAALCLLTGWYVLGRWGFAAALAAELIVALDIPSILLSATILTDSLFQGLVTVGIVLDLWIVWRGQNDRIAIAGILIAATLLGVAILVRPLGIVFPAFAMLPVFLLPRTGWRQSLSIGLLAFAIPSLMAFGWMTRNDRTTGVYTLSSVGPLNLYYFRAAGVVWYRGDKSFQSVQEDLGREIGWPRENFEEAPTSLESAMIHRAYGILRNDPLASIIMTLRCLGWLAIVPLRGSLNEFLGTNAGASSYFAASGNVTARIQELVRSPLLTVLVVLQLLLMGLVWVGVVRSLFRFGRKSTTERVLLLTPFIFALILLGLSAGPEAMARYRMPVIPLLAILAAVGWFGKFESSKLRNQAEHFPARPVPQPSIARGQHQAFALGAVDRLGAST